VTQTDLRAVLWDLDGTVLDSREVHWDAWRTFSARQGKAMTLDFFTGTFGFRNEIILRRHLGEDLADEHVEELALGKEALYRELLTEAGIQPLPGVREWLQWAADRGFRQAVASMAPRANIDVTLAALQLPVKFQAIVSGEEVRHGKPDPEVFLLAAERLGVPPERCTVVEDSVQGVEAAKRAGMRCIGAGPLHEILEADVRLRTLAAGDPQLLERV
jgi:beta-phosphoglucomutase family hydrolase